MFSTLVKAMDYHSRDLKPNNMNSDTDFSNSEILGWYPIQLSHRNRNKKPNLLNP